MSNQRVQPDAPRQPDAQQVTIVQIAPEEPARELSMIDVSLAAFNLIGAIMAAAVLAGLVAGVTYIWFRSRRAVTTIEARGGHNLFRGNH